MIKNEQYIINYKISPGKQTEFHNSYIGYLRELTLPVLQKELCKHSHPAGEYTAWIRMCFLKGAIKGNGALLLNKPYSFSIWVNRPDSQVGWIQADFDSDNMIFEEETHSRYINPLEDISKHKPVFKIVSVDVLPCEAELNERARKSAENFLKCFDKFSFPCELAAEDFPDIIFEIRYDAAEDAVSDRICSALEKWVTNYNRRSEKNGGNIIHFIQRIECGCEQENTVCIHIDFGQCSPGLILNAVKALGKSNLPVTQVIIR